MLRATPPRIVPTLAEVTSSIRPSRMSATARAAAAIAERPSSGAMPAWADCPVKVISMIIECGAPRITSPIGPAWS